MNLLDIWRVEPHTTQTLSHKDLSVFLTCLFIMLFGYLPTDEDQETSGDFGSGGAVILLDDQEEEPSQNGRSRQKKRRGRIHPRGAIEDDEDEEDDKDDEIGYVW